jgi:hypothetical protein
VAVVGVLLSGRPTLSVASYTPFEPRIQVLLGARYSYAGPEPARVPLPKAVRVPSAQREVAKTEPAAVSPPVASELVVTVVNAQGEPLPDVRVALEAGEALQSGGSGTARFSGLIPGERNVAVTADGFVAQNARVELAAGAPFELHVVLEAARQVALLRLLVRDAESGAPVLAELGIAALAGSKGKRVQASTASDGSFEQELPAGRYRLQLRAPGYQPQTRMIDVGERGVTLFNVDLAPVSP